MPDKGDRKRELLFLMIDLMIVIIAWGGFYRESFGTDTLFRRMLPMSDIGGALDQQRYLSYVFAKTLLDLGILVTDHYQLFFLLFLLAIAADIRLIQKLFYPAFSKAAGTDLLSLCGFIACTALTHINVLFSENFMFPEYHINYAFAYLLGTFAVCAFAREHILRGSVFIMLACLFYQVAIVYAAILLTAYFVIENGFVPDGKLIRKTLVCNFLILLIGLLDYLSNGWLKAAGLLEKTAGGKVIRPSFGNCIAYLFEETCLLFKNSLRLIPLPWLPLIAALCGLGVLIHALIRKKNGTGCILCLLLIVEAAWFYLFPFLAGEGSMTPRVAFTAYVVQSVIALAAMIMTEKEKLRRILSAVVIVYLFVQIFFGQKIIGDRYLSNHLDVLYAKAVLREIGRYEEETGNHVTRVAVENDAYAPNSYKEITFKRDQINERVLAVSPYTLLEYVNGSGIFFEHVEMDPDIYEKHFAGRDWDAFDPGEQLVFDRDTLYWVVF